MSHEKQKEFGDLIAQLICRKDMDRHTAKTKFTEVLENRQTQMQQGAFLAALTAKGETAPEIAGIWEAIYEADTVKISPDTSTPVVDNCGTGMDSIKTFNISTAASVIAAAAGIKMAKHGARAITSTCGTIDILEELGVDVECEPAIVKQSIERAGIGIFNGMSPKVHPQALGRILSQISFGTVLNIAASLANPALPKYGVRGVYSRALVEPVTRVMRDIGYKKALVVHGLDAVGILGMDEASTLGETVIGELKESGEINIYSFFPEDIGISRTQNHMLAPLNDRKQEARRLVSILRGQEDESRIAIVCLNAGLILFLMDLSCSIVEGYKKAREIIFSGQAIGKLKDWVREQNSDSETGLIKLGTLLEAAEI